MYSVIFSLKLQCHEKLKLIVLYILYILKCGPGKWVGPLCFIVLSVVSYCTIGILNLDSMIYYCT